MALRSARSSARRKQSEGGGHDHRTQPPRLYLLDRGACRRARLSRLGRRCGCTRGTCAAALAPARSAQFLYRGGKGRHGHRLLRQDRRRPGARHLDCANGRRRTRRCAGPRAARHGRHCPHRQHGRRQRSNRRFPRRHEFAPDGGGSPPPDDRHGCRQARRPGGAAYRQRRRHPGSRRRRQAHLLCTIDRRRRFPRAHQVEWEARPRARRGRASQDQGAEGL